MHISYGCCNAGVTTKSNKAMIIGIVVGVVIAVAFVLLVLCCRFWRLRRIAAAAKARSAAAAAAKEGKAGKHGVAVNAAADGVIISNAVGSPDHVQKMQKLQNMAFARTQSGHKGQIGAGAVGNSPAAKGFAFPDVAKQSDAFGSPLSAESPVYTPRGTNLISRMFSAKSGTQVSTAIKQAINPSCECLHMPGG